jgi:molybdopterin synthase sulfur carrier subunit
MITVKFFASLREQLDTEQVHIDGDAIDTVAALQKALADRGENWRAALEDHRILAAVNQAIAKPSTPIKAGDEIAFFPPVTGG